MTPPWPQRKSIKLTVNLHISARTLPSYNCQHQRQCRLSEVTTFVCLRSTVRVNVYMYSIYICVCVGALSNCVLVCRNSTLSLRSDLLLCFYLTLIFHLQFIAFIVFVILLCIFVLVPFVIFHFTSQMFRHKSFSLKNFIAFLTVLLLLSIAQLVAAPLRSVQHSSAQVPLTGYAAANIYYYCYNFMLPLRIVFLTFVLFVFSQLLSCCRCANHPSNWLTGNRLRGG